MLKRNGIVDYEEFFPTFLRGSLHETPCEGHTCTLADGFLGFDVANNCVLGIRKPAYV